MSMKEKPRKWRALVLLVYAPDLRPDKEGCILARPGEIFELYPEILEYPDRVALAVKLGLIEPVPETPIVRPDKETKETTRDQA